MDDSQILCAPVDEELFLDALEYVHKHHPRAGDEDADFTRVIQLLSTFLSISHPEIDKPWEVIGSIQTRVSALLMSRDCTMSSVFGFRSIGSDSQAISENVLRAAAAAPLSRTVEGRFVFRPSAFLRQTK